MSTVRDQVGLSAGATSLGTVRWALDVAQCVVKRSLDIGAAFLLIVILAPLLAALAVAVRLDSRGPALFSQTRIGRNRRRGARPYDGPDRRKRDAYGQPFSIYKFRTMRADAPVYAVSPSNGRDPRVTAVGQTLRATCLDELPQLFNVLSGHMSLVGPRPEMPFIVSQYRDVHRRRLEVRPGITCLWQIEGPRNRPIHEAVEYDLEYIDGWSLWMDAQIMARTVWFVLKARNH